MSYALGKLTIDLLIMFKLNVFLLESVINTLRILIIRNIGIQKDTIERDGEYFKRRENFLLI